MTNVSRPLLGLLVATVLFFGLWIVALRPSSSSTSPNGTGPGLGQYQSAINKAKASAAAQDRAAAAANGTSATSKPAAAATAAKPATAAATAHHAGSRVRASTSTKTASRTRTATAPASHVATATQRLNTVERALAEHKVLALLVYNPAGSDDQAVKQELGTIPTSRGRVVKVAIPLSEITKYPVITNQVAITGTPTLVIVDASWQAFTIVGFADRFEIAKRIGDALGMR